MQVPATDRKPSWPAGISGELLSVFEEARTLGFLGPGPVSTQVDHALDFATILRARTAARALDLGSGGGLPGLVLAAVLPELQIVLLDSQQRRTVFLARVVEALGWAGRVAVVTARAEDHARVADARRAFDVVVARSFGPPAATAECAAGLLRTGGVLVVSEPPTGRVDDRWPAAGLTLLEQRLVVGASLAALSHRFAVIEQVAACDERYPRRSGFPAKRPLFVSQGT